MVLVCVYMHMHMLQCPRGSQRTPWWSQFSPFTKQVPQTELWLLGLATSSFSHLATSLPFSLYFLRCDGGDWGDAQLLRALVAFAATFGAQYPHNNS